MSFRKIVIVAALLAVKSEAVNIDCIFRNTAGFVVIGTAYECFATVTLTGNTNVESVTGVHLTGRYNDDVRAFRINSQNMPFLSSGVADHFKNLVFLEISFSGLQSISAEDFQPFPQILVLWLYGNNLVNLDDDLFKFNTKLQYITLSYNQIEHIGNDLVTHLSDLTWLYLYSNVCINQGATNRNAVVALAATLSTLCPPLETTSTTTTTVAPTTTTTVAPTTTELPIEKCSCVEEIDELHLLNEASGFQIEQLHLDNQEQNLEIEKLHEANQQQNLEIESLHLENRQKDREIQELQESNANLLTATAAYEKWMVEVEMQLRELASRPCA